MGILMASLDLKLRFPPHVLQKISGSVLTPTALTPTALTPTVFPNSTTNITPHHATPTLNSSVQRTEGMLGVIHSHHVNTPSTLLPNTKGASVAPPVRAVDREKGYALPIIACIILIIPLMGIGHHWAAPGYLIISPVPTYCILSCTSRQPAHKNLAHASIILGATAFTVGAAAAIASCICIKDIANDYDIHTTSTVTNYNKLVHPLLSTSITIGIAQLILILNKTDVAKVMVCTACAMLVGVMVIVAPFMSNSIALSCYRGVCVPLLFLFWNTLGTKHVVLLPINNNEVV